MKWKDQWEALLKLLEERKPSKYERNLYISYLKEYYSNHNKHATYESPQQIFESFLRKHCYNGQIQ